MEKAQRIVACACAVAAHAAIIIIVGAFTAIEFMCVVFGTNIVVNAIAMKVQAYFVYVGLYSLANFAQFK